MLIYVEIMKIFIDIRLFILTVTQNTLSAHRHTYNNVKTRGAQRYCSAAELKTVIVAYRCGSVV